jgi:hypothetical protein
LRGDYEAESFDEEQAAHAVRVAKRFIDAVVAAVGE